ncbi:hypothetical protein L2E82_22747 [Cichorium intybus]|uniref:Uncharacterized protein n=1 Tax=Cichorium intybus TaxID=13427 RepID=A0ACB9DYW4_CICIN|nr:hypothetical protein L2E82_22747 [Cichorium intybus]
MLLRGDAEIDPQDKWVSTGDLNAKSHEEDTYASSSITRLADEIILQILNKLLDLKILCVCYLVSKRFPSIVLQVDAVSFTAPLLDSNVPDNNAASACHFFVLQRVLTFRHDVSEQVQ